MFRCWVGLHDEPGWKRLSRNNGDGCQRTRLYEMDWRAQLHDIGNVDCQWHQRCAELLPSCSVYQLEWTFVCHSRWIRNCQTGTMRRHLLRYTILPTHCTGIGVEVVCPSKPCLKYYPVLNMGFAELIERIVTSNGITYYSVIIVSSNTRYIISI